MRTTIDLDPDVDARLRSIARERDLPLKVVINQALRDATHVAQADGPAYDLPTRSLGVRPGVNLEKALSLASELEDEELLRKLELRK